MGGVELGISKIIYKRTKMNTIIKGVLLKLKYLLIIALISLFEKLRFYIFHCFKKKRLIKN